MAVGAIELHQAYAAPVGLKAMAPRAPDAAFLRRLAGEPGARFIVALAPALYLRQRLEPLDGLFFVDRHGHDRLLPEPLLRVPVSHNDHELYKPQAIGVKRGAPD